MRAGCDAEAYLCIHSITCHSEISFSDSSDLHLVIRCRKWSIRSRSVAGAPSFRTTGKASRRPRVKSIESWRWEPSLRASTHDWGRKARVPTRAPRQRVRHYRRPSKKRPGCLAPISAGGQQQRRKPSLFPHRPSGSFRLTCLLPCACLVFGCDVL